MLKLKLEIKQPDSLYGKQRKYKASFSSSSDSRNPKPFKIVSDFHRVCSHQHRITGSIKSALSVEIVKNGGGILADDMGLGKSLTMLSNIVGSLDHAQEYANSIELSRSSTSDDIVRVELASKSTLVVVPSARGFYLKNFSHMLLYMLIMERESVLLDGWMEEVRKSALPFELIHL